MPRLTRDYIRLLNARQSFCYWSNRLRLLRLITFIRKKTQKRIKMHRIPFAILTKFLIIISEPASAARCSPVFDWLSFTREFIFTLTLINERTVSISEFCTAMWRKFLPLLSTLKLVCLYNCLKLSFFILFLNYLFGRVRILFEY